jgi:predicted N-formylglutamate amidohydrolase
MGSSVSKGGNPSKKGSRYIALFLVRNSREQDAQLRHNIPLEGNAGTTNTIPLYTGCRNILSIYLQVRKKNFLQEEKPAREAERYSYDTRSLSLLPVTTSHA